MIHVSVKNRLYVPFRFHAQDMSNIMWHRKFRYNLYIFKSNNYITFIKNIVYLNLWVSEAAGKLFVVHKGQ